MSTQKNIFGFEPIQTFIRTLGKGIERYFGSDKSAIVYLKPDGVWYAEGLYQWLKKKKKDVTITSMEDGGDGLEEEKVRERKVLIIINESFTGKAQKRSMEAMRARKDRLKIKGIKFAAYRDRPGTADFSVDRYSTELLWRVEDLDAKDLKIIALLGENGRASFASLATVVGLSQVAVKNRLAHLFQNKILNVQGLLNTERFYALSAGIQIAADSKTIEKLIESFEQKQEVYHIRKRSGRHNLVVGILARTVEEVEEFVEKEVRSAPGVKEMDVYIGELPIVPRFIFPKSIA